MQRESEGLYMKRDTDVIIPLEVLILNDLLSSGAIGDQIHSKALEIFYQSRAKTEKTDLHPEPNLEKEL